MAPIFAGSIFVGRVVGGGSDGTPTIAVWLAIGISSAVVIGLGFGWVLLWASRHRLNGQLSRYRDLSAATSNYAMRIVSASSLHYPSRQGRKLVKSPVRLGARTARLGWVAKRASMPPSLLSRKKTGIDWFSPLRRHASDGQDMRRKSSWLDEDSLHGPKVRKGLAADRFLVRNSWPARTPTLPNLGSPERTLCNRSLYTHSNRPIRAPARVALPLGLSNRWTRANGSTTDPGQQLYSHGQTDWQLLSDDEGTAGYEAKYSNRPPLPVKAGLAGGIVRSPLVRSWPVQPSPIRRMHSSTTDPDLDLASILEMTAQRLQEGGLSNERSRSRRRVGDNVEMSSPIKSHAGSRGTASSVGSKQRSPYNYSPARSGVGSPRSDSWGAAEDVGTPSSFNTSFDTEAALADALALLMPPGEEDDEGQGADQAGSVSGRSPVGTPPGGTSPGGFIRRVRGISDVSSALSTVYSMDEGSEVSLSSKTPKTMHAVVSVPTPTRLPINQTRTGAQPKREEDSRGHNGGGGGIAGRPRVTVSYDPLLSPISGNVRPDGWLAVDGGRTGSMPIISPPHCFGSDEVSPKAMVHVASRGADSGRPLRGLSVAGPKKTLAVPGPSLGRRILLPPPKQLWASGQLANSKETSDDIWTDPILVDDARERLKLRTESDGATAAPAAALRSLVPNTGSGPGRRSVRADENGSPTPLERRSKTGLLAGSGAGTAKPSTAGSPVGRVSVLLRASSGCRGDGASPVATGPSTTSQPGQYQHQPSTPLGGRLDQGAAPRVEWTADQLRRMNSQRSTGSVASSPPVDATASAVKRGLSEQRYNGDRDSRNGRMAGRRKVPLVVVGGARWNAGVGSNRGDDDDDDDDASAANVSLYDQDGFLVSSPTRASRGGGGESGGGKRRKSVRGWAVPS